MARKVLVVATHWMLSPSLGSYKVTLNVSIYILFAVSCWTSVIKVVITLHKNFYIYTLLCFVVFFINTIFPAFVSFLLFKHSSTSGRKRRGRKSYVFITTTMWHETRREMSHLLQSIARVDAVCKQTQELHIRNVEDIFVLYALFCIYTKHTWQYIQYNTFIITYIMYSTLNHTLQTIHNLRYIHNTLYHKTLHYIHTWHQRITCNT